MITIFRKYGTIFGMLALVLLCAFWPSDKVIEEQFQESDRSVTVKSVLELTADDILAEELGRNILAVCRHLVEEHPDPVARRDFAEILSRYKRKEWLFAVNTEPSRRFSGARFHNGRPLIVIHLRTLAPLFQKALEEHGEEAVTSSMGMIGAMMVLHEGYHIREGHLNDLGVDFGSEVHLQRESDAWWYMVEHGLMPLKQKGGLPLLIVPQFDAAVKTYELSDSVMWMRFIRAAHDEEDYNTFVADLYGGE